MRHLTQKDLNTVFALGIVLTLWGMLPACKSEVQVLEADTEIEAEIIDDQGNKISGAILGLFDNEALFKEAVVKRDFASAIQQDTSNTAGVASFTRLTPNVKYYIACKYADSNRFAGISLEFNNSQINNQLALTLRKGSKNFVRIRVVPDDGLLVIYAPSTESKRVPLRVTVNNASVGQLLKTTDVPPAGITDSAALTTQVRKGKATYSVRSTECDWSGTLTIAGGELNYLALPPCQVGTLGFYTRDTTSARFPMSIELNNVEIAAYLQSGTLKATVDCGDSAVAAINRGIGSYVYSVRTADRKCSWIGITNIKLNECTLISLPKCTR